MFHHTRSMILVIANVVSRTTPVTRGFWLRNQLFRAAGVRVASDAKLCGGVQMDNAHVIIGNATWIGGGTRLIGAPDAVVTIEPNCDIGPDVLLVTGSHKLGSSSRRAGAGTRLPILVGAGTWIGARTVVLGGVNIGPGSVIGASSLVRDNVPADTLFAGNPARRVKDLR